jgi:prolyl oligopeptidase
MARPTIVYPPTAMGDVVDDYHGTPVADPYRWLEDPESLATRAWMESQNQLTAAWVDTPERAQIRQRLTTLYDYRRQSAPTLRGGRHFYSVNEGLQNQPVIFVREAGRARALLDPNLLGADGTVAVTAFAPSDDGRLLGYALSTSGSDRQIVRVRDVATGRDLPDLLRFAKFTDITWTLDGAGFFYTRFPDPADADAVDPHYFAKVFFHRIGQDQSEDRLIYERPDEREAVMATARSADGRWLVITVFRGASDDSEIHLVDLARPFDGSRPLFTGFTNSYVFVGAIHDRLYFRTTSAAPNGRLIAVGVGQGPPAPDAGEPASTTIVEEQSDALSAAHMANARIVAVYLHHASDRVRIFDLDGRPLSDLALPTLGSVTEMTAEVDQEELFLRYSTFTSPPIVYRYDVPTGVLEPWPDAQPAAARRDDAYVTEQVWYPSKDGTPVSMFLIHRRGLPADGQRPVFLTGYGGFNIPLTPQYDPGHFIWLEAGGLVAVPNLRGGGEYGEAWHRAGMFERKQTVFDDFIAAAEWLVGRGYTRPERIAAEGGSNGGLLVGAVLVQRPDLFGAAVCRVPVVDMLRYHRFTVGRFWVSEYGSADDARAFQYLYAYSPLHNVKDGVRYPPTLIMTADTDDRVDPSMARKFAARLQAATASEPDAGPILIRIETRAGHGTGKPVGKLLDEDADIYAFLWRALELANG